MKSKSELEAIKESEAYMESKWPKLNAKKIKEQAAIVKSELSKFDDMIQGGRMWTAQDTGEHMLLDCAVHNLENCYRQVNDVEYFVIQVAELEAKKKEQEESE